MKEKRKEKRGGKKFWKPEREENTVEQEMLFDIWLDIKVIKESLLLCRKGISGDSPLPGSDSK